MDVGSSSIKICALDSGTYTTLFSRYKPHYSDQIKTVSDLLDQTHNQITSRNVRLAFTGSGGKRFADMAGALYVQEIVDSFYSNSYKDPVYTIQNALLSTFRNFEEGGVSLRILGCGTTGYSGGVPAKALRNKQLCRYFEESFGIGKEEVFPALFEAERAEEQFRTELIDAGVQVISDVEKSGEFAVILAGRPYHNDMLVNHHISSHFTSLGVPVLTGDSIPDLDSLDMDNLRIDPVKPFHMRMYASALYGAKHPNLEIVQLASFGCGHDGIMIDEMARIVCEVSGKHVLVLKIDEGEAEAPLNIRIRSFVETVRAKRSRERGRSAVKVKELPDPFRTKFHRKDHKKKFIFTPNISKAHCDLISAITRRAGYKSVPMPIADRRVEKRAGSRYRRALDEL